MVGVSVPRFVLAPLLILVFSLKLYLFPVARWETWRHMVLPVLCAGLPMAAYIARLTRGGMLEVIRSRLHPHRPREGALRARVDPAARAPGRTAPGGELPRPGFSDLLVGSLVVEKIFNIPGMGRYFVEAATNRDYNLVMGVMLVYGVLADGASTRSSTWPTRTSTRAWSCADRWPAAAAARRPGVGRAVPGGERRRGTRPGGPLGLDAAGGGGRACGATRGGGSGRTAPLWPRRASSSP